MTNDTTAAFAEMRWSTTVSLTPTIDSLERTNTNTAPQINFPSNRSCKTTKQYKYAKFFY
ncbi:hypothetical protein Hanom_Chr06g00555761 [Helianthus anomalus]